MSSRSRIWSRAAQRVTALAALSILLTLPGVLPIGMQSGRALPIGVQSGVLPAAAAPVPLPLPVTGVLTGDGQAAAVVDLSDVTAAGDRSATVTTGGVEAPATLEPVLSGDTAVVLVVDTSADGAATTPAWLSAAARFTLEAPALTRSVVVTAGRPAAVAGAAQTGPLEVVRTLDGLEPGGARDTAAALTLAAGQFPDAPPGRRVVMVYTSAPDAGGESAAALGERLRASGTMLVVAGTAGAEFWSAATAVTGGFFAPAGDPVVVPALDQVQTTLRARHLVRFPAEAPARAVITVTSGGETFTGEAQIPGTPAAAPDRAPARSVVVWVLLGVAALALAVALGVLLLRRRRPPAAPGEPSAPAAAAPYPAAPNATAAPNAAALNGAAPNGAASNPAAAPNATAASNAAGLMPPAEPTPPPARGRAVVADPAPEVARGRASVPGTETETA